MFDILHAPLSDRQAISLLFGPCITSPSCVAESCCPLQSQKDLGFLLNPGEGAISAVAMYVPVGAMSPTHLFSGGVDGTLAVWSAGKAWDCLKVCSHSACDPLEGLMLNSVNSTRAHVCCQFMPCAYD